MQNNAGAEREWCCMRKSGAAEKCFREGQDKTVESCAVGLTEVGLHQGSESILIWSGDGHKHSAGLK